MREYEVTVPIAGAVYMTVIAESEEDAINKVMDTATMDDIGEWEALRHITKGNVCYAPVWSASAEDSGEVDGDQAGS